MITLDRLTIHQGNFCLRDVEMAIPTGDYGILMGPTGSGKTTLLEAVCGLRPTTSGRILLDDQEVTRFPASARQIGYVPQDSALFPTMRVDQQIEFGLQVRREARPAREQRVAELAQLLGISDLLKRYPHGLSGGEQQRVALARALSFKPRLLCLDEPLSSLDDSTRHRLTDLLREVHRRERVTVLHITHNSAEARELGTVRFHITDGKIENA
jgi:molybdate/tungstate transport system ATP-binding protein